METRQEGVVAVFNENKLVAVVYKDLQGDGRPWVFYKVEEMGGDDIIALLNKKEN